MQTVATGEEKKTADMSAYLLYNNVVDQSDSAWSMEHQSHSAVLWELLTAALDLQVALPDEHFWQAQGQQPAHVYIKAKWYKII